MQDKRRFLLIAIVMALTVVLAIGPTMAAPPESVDETTHIRLKFDVLIFEVEFFKEIVDHHKGPFEDDDDSTEVEGDDDDADEGDDDDHDPGDGNDDKETDD